MGPRARRSPGHCPPAGAPSPLTKRATATLFLRIFAARRRNHCSVESDGETEMMLHRKALQPLVAAIIAGTFAVGARAGATEPITLTARLAQPVMKSGERQTNFLRIGLNGCAPPRHADPPPGNVAFVIDRSGSMSGERIAQARQAAGMAGERPGHQRTAPGLIL